MVLQATCEYCGEKHKFKRYYSTRVNFKMHEGRTYQAKCARCNKEFVVDINRITAIYSIPSFVIISSLLIIATGFAYWIITNHSLGFKPVMYQRPHYTLPLFPVLIFLMYFNFEKSKIKTFNRTRA